ncbi:MAG: hypothetical protein HGA25_09040, partial [Clostridiales bacterium]|nr:hypothetical protein [Clostridiales bacterium]
YFSQIETVYDLTSSDPSVIAIDNNGPVYGGAYSYLATLHALNGGTTTISFKYKYYTSPYYWQWSYASITINVQSPKTEVSIYADDLTKVYDGQVMNGTFRAVGLAAGHTITAGVTVSGTATDYTATPVVSTVAIDTSKLKIVDGTGKDVTSKYNLTVKDAKGNLTITKRSVTITANPQTRTYSEADNFTGTVESFNASTKTGLVNAGDIGTVVYERTSRVGEVLAVNEYPNMIGVKNTFAQYKNYDVKIVTAKLKVTKASITINVQNATKTYGDADPAFEGVLSGKLLNANDLGMITYSRTRETAGREDSWDNIDLTAKYTRNNNYDVTVKDAKLTITKRKISITVDDKTKVYGQWDPAFTGTITSGSLVPNAYDHIVYMREWNDFDKEDAGDSIEIIAYVAYGFGYYKNNNYEVTLDTGALTITQKPVTITVDSKQKYFGDSDPVFTGTITSGGFFAGDHVRITYARTLDTATLEDVGADIDITAVVKSRKTEDLDNYNISIITGKLSIVKAPAIGTITGEGFTKTYDGVAQALAPASAADTAESIYDITYSVDGGEFTQALPEFKYVKTDLDGNVVPYIV